MTKEVKKLLDEWYLNYCRENNKAPSIQEMADKLGELEGEDNESN